MVASLTAKIQQAITILSHFSNFWNVLDSYPFCWITNVPPFVNYVSFIIISLLRKLVKAEWVHLPSIKFRYQFIFGLIHIFNPWNNMIKCTLGLNWQKYVSILSYYWPIHGLFERNMYGPTLGNVLAICFLHMDVTMSIWWVFPLKKDKNLTFSVFTNYQGSLCVLFILDCSKRWFFFGFHDKVSHQNRFRAKVFFIWRKMLPVGVILGMALFYLKMCPFYHIFALDAQYSQSRVSWWTYTYTKSVDTQNLSHPQNKHFYPSPP